MPPLVVSLLSLPLTYRSARAVADHVVGCGGAGRMFVRAHRLLLDHPAIMAAAGRLDRRHAANLPLLEEFGAWLYPAALAEGEGETEGDLTLAALAARQIHGSLVRALAGAGAPEAFDAVASLLCAIDQRCGPALVARFFALLPASAEGVLLVPDLPFPKPPFAFGSGVVHPAGFAPESGVSTDYLTLEHEYLVNLAAPLHREACDRPPVLHPASSPARVDRSVWRVAMLSPLVDSGEIAWQTDADRTRFWASSLHEDAHAVVMARLRRLLEACGRQRCDLILVPELNGDPAVVQVLQEFASASTGTLPWIVVGSMHEEVPAFPGTYRNRPRIVTPRGELPWNYWKSDPVKISLDGEAGSLKEALARDVSPVVAMDGPFGRMAVVICKDFLLDEVRLRVEQLRATTVVVLAMTTSASVTDFSNLARGFAGRNRAVSLFCNCASAFRRELAVVERRFGREAADRRRSSRRWELGLVHTNTVTTEGEAAFHALPDSVEPCVAFYTLTATHKGLRATVTTGT